MNKKEYDPARGLTRFVKNPEKDDSVLKNKYREKSGNLGNGVDTGQGAVSEDASNERPKTVRGKRVCYLISRQCDNGFRQTKAAACFSEQEQCRTRSTHS